MAESPFRRVDLQLNAPTVRKKKKPSSTKRYTFGGASAVTAAAPRSAGRPAPRAALFERYGLVFDPARENDPVTKAEQDALLELYRSQTGREADDEPDLRVALNQAGLLRAPGGGRLRKKDDEPVFASAADALDYLRETFQPLLYNKPAVDLFLQRGPFREGGPVDRATAVPFEAAGRAIGDVVEGARSRGLTTTGEGITGRPPIRSIGAPERVQFGGGIEGRPLLRPRYDLPKPTRPFVERVSDIPAYRFGIGSFTPEGRRQAEIYGEAGPFSLFRVRDETLGGLARGESRRAGIVGLPGELEEPIAITTPEIEAFANTYLSEAERRGEFDPERLNKVFGWFEFMRYGAPALEGQEAQQQIVGESLRAWERDILLAEARKRGQDIADPSRYTDAELARRAFTREGAFEEAKRSAFRQFGELSALPAAAAAVAGVVASGDKDEWIALGKDLIGPYVYLWDDIERRGFEAAVSSFAQERPLDALLITNAAARLGGRSAGGAARLAGGTQRGLLQTLVKSNPQPGSFRYRIGQFARENRPVTVPSPPVARMAGDVEEPLVGDVAIGFTGRNLLDTLVLEGRARAAAGLQGRFDRTARLVAGNRARRAVRIAENRADDARAQVGREMIDVASGLNRQQLLRLAVELTVAQVRAVFDETGRLADELEPYDVASRAAFYRDAAAAKLRAADDVGGTQGRRLRREARSLERSAKTWQAIADTELPDGVVDAARDALRRIGQDNDVMVAYLMDELGIRDSPPNLSRADTLASGLIPGRDFIDVGDADVGVVPARVVGVERVGNRLRVTTAEVRDPTRTRVLEVDRAQLVPVLSSGVRRAKYIRQFIEFEAQLKAAASALTRERRGAERLRVREANRPLVELGRLDNRRRTLSARLAVVADEVDRARVEGRQPSALLLRRWNLATRRLSQLLGRMERAAVAAGLDDVARQLRAERVELSDARRRMSEGGEFPLATLQQRVARSVEAGDLAPAVVRLVEQPEARAALERAGRLREQAARAARVEETWAAERAAAPSAAQAGRARRELPDLRDRIASLRRQAGEAATRDARNVFLADARRLEERQRVLEERVAGREAVAPAGAQVPLRQRSPLRGGKYIVGADNVVRDRATGAVVFDPETGVPVERLTPSRRRSLRKALLREADKETRRAARIIRSGAPVIRTDDMSVVLAASKRELGVDLRAKRQKPVKFSVSAVQAELENEFIARAEMMGMEPVLWLGTRSASFGGARGRFVGAGKLDVSSAARLPGSRFETLRGEVARAGLEDMRRAWRNLISDTGAIRGNEAWVREMRAFAIASSIKVTRLTEREAFAINRRAGKVDPDARTIELSEAESAVWDAREYVPFQLEKPGVMDRRQLVGELPEDVQSLADLFKREATEADLVKAGQDYYLMPRYLYDQITSELEDIAYRPGATLSFFDSLTKAWRTFTLNIFPRTGFANLVGSITLAAIGGAGPRSFYLAYRHLRYGDVPAPLELRQRFGMTLTTDVDFAWARQNNVWLDSPLGGLAWWMNTMRRFNGISEDFGRLAVWYSRAAREANRRTDASFRESWLAMGRLTDEANAVLEAFAKHEARDPEIQAAAQRFVDYSFEWLGDLHSGGALNTRLRVFIPFQQWYRHIIRLTFVTMPLKYPGRMLFLTRLSEIGREYQREHGVFPEWFSDVLPIMIEEKMIEGIPQEYIFAWRLSNLNVFPTATEGLVTGEFQWADYGASMLTPIWKNLIELVLSGLDGQSTLIAGKGSQPAYNAAGNTIPFNVLLLDEQSRGLFLNKLFYSLPLTSQIASMAGQTPEGNRLFGGGAPRLIRGPEGVLPEYMLAPDAPGRDLVQVATDFSYENLFAWLARAMVGGSGTYVTSRGPITDMRVQEQVQAYQAEDTRYMNNIIREAEARRQSEAP